jgi:hypothetical protein
MWAWMSPARFEVGLSDDHRTVWQYTAWDQADPWWTFSQNVKGCARVLYHREIPMFWLGALGVLGGERQPATVRSRR